LPGPLDGIKIIEFTQIIAAPFGGMLLADMGAEIIKVEPLEGEPWRLHTEFIPKESKTFIGLNRGKKSLPLDLQSPEGLEIAQKLVADADVVIINARPDVPKNLGIDYETLSQINPKIIYCDNTAFGRRGPHGYRPGYDLIVQAMSGLLAADNKVVDGVPQQVTATAVADYTTGVAIAWGVSAALFSREKTGKGQKIDTTLLSTSLLIQGGFMELEDHGKDEKDELVETLGALREAGLPYTSLLEQQQVYSPFNTAFRIYYTTYQTSNDVIAIACLSNRLRKKAADAIGVIDPRFSDDFDPDDPDSIDAIESLSEQIKSILITKTCQEWLAIFDDAGVPAGPVRFIQELTDDEQVIANDMVVEVNHSLAGKVRMAGPMIQMSETPLEAKSASPALGEHTDQIMLELGYSEEEITDLRSRNITL
jgi:crotonobetainyl-CoA:carnitine CoA-transferase CaiB-like acyl-CoA transferase|tara:strand:+ start:1730 stop:2998 length:1269 start_codon:yes stop_codon:yes gene_type:complete